jgi:hypothetical protein
MNASTRKTTPIPSGTPVRYIKLGQQGSWEKECLQKGIIRYGFDSANPERFPLCIGRQWDGLLKSFVKEGRDKGKATDLTKQTRLFFDDDGSTLWITFINQKLYWGHLDKSAPTPHEDGDGVWRTVEGGWRSDDRNGEPLTMDSLAGSLTKIAGFRGTSCNVDMADYLIRRINGKKSPEVEHAVVALNNMKSSVLEMIKLLDPGDFETLVDLVFSTSGWRRQGPVGKTQKTLDLDLTLPSTGERAFVQVKSKTTSAELAGYVTKFNELDLYGRMFYVYHSGEANTDADRVIVVGPDKLAELVLDAGLTNWLIRKVS